MLGGAGFHASLIDRTGGNKSCAHSESRVSCVGCSNTACRTHSWHRGILVTRLEFIAQRQDGRQQQHQRTIVGVPAGIGFGGDVIRHREVLRPKRLFRRNLAVSDQLIQDVIRRRAEEARGNFFTREFGNDAVAGNNFPVRVCFQSSHAVLHQRRGNVHVSRCFHGANAVFEVEFSRPALHGGLIRAVDQVEGVRSVREGSLNFVDGPFQPCRNHPGGAKRPQQAGFA